MEFKIIKLLKKWGVKDVIHTSSNNTHDYFTGVVDGVKHHFSHNISGAIHARLDGSQELNFMAYSDEFVL